MNLEVSRNNAHMAKAKRFVSHVLTEKNIS